MAELLGGAENVNNSTENAGEVSAVEAGTSAVSANDGRDKSLESAIDPTTNSGSLSASPVDNLEAGFYRMLMNPLLERLEDSANKNNEILDALTQKLKEERERDRKKQLSLHIPSVLHAQGRDLEETIQHLENFIEYENYDPENTDQSKLRKATLRELDKAAELAIIGHSIGAFVSTLDAPHLKHLATNIVRDVTSWLVKLFRFSEASAYFHEEEKEGLVKICQLALHKKYAKYVTDGYEVLYTRPPVIYISAAAKPNLGQFICHQLGLPLSCLCIVPCNVTHMNVSVLQKLVEDDMSSGKTPTIVIAYAGTSLAGQTDDLTRLHEICQLHDVWLHLDGCALSMLAVSSIPAQLSSATVANSMTLRLADWLALPAIPLVTLFRSPDVAMTRAVGLSTFNVRYKLNCMSLWLCVVYLGQDQITARLQYYMTLAKAVHDGLGQIPTSNELIVMELESPVVLVRYQMKQDGRLVDGGAAAVAAESHDAINSDAVKDNYVDTLNLWLLEALRREVPDVHIVGVELPGVGLYIRYAPLETGDVFEMTSQSVDSFLRCFTRHVHILDATVAVKQDFADIVDSQDNLRLIQLPSWAGLGAVQYVPNLWVDQMDSLPDVGKNEINIVNQQLVNRLKSTDTAFSLGVTSSGLYCVRFGLVTADTDLEELIAMVYANGKDVEESSKYLESVADIVKQGIVKAVEDLEKENQEKLMQEGVLRQVPLVGSLINWWSPPPKDPIKGRAFDLTSGSVMSTENTYKYHIQVQENTASSSSSLTSASLSLGAQSLHTGPLKQLLKPASGRKAHTGVTSSASERLGSGDHTPTETEMMNVADGDCEDDMPASTNPPADDVTSSVADKEAVMSSS